MDDIEKPWHKFIKEEVDNAPEKQGVYEIASVTPEGRKLWRIGRTPHLHTRLSKRLCEPPPPENCYFRYYEVEVSTDLDIIAGKLYGRYNKMPSASPKE